MTPVLSRAGTDVRGTWPTGTMAALAMTGPHRLSRDQVPVPGPRPGTALVRPRFLGLCGTDLELWHGSSGYLTDGSARYPHVFGHEWWGEVVAVAEQDAGLTPGDAVVGQTMLPCGRCPACGRGRRQLCSRMREVGLRGAQGAAAEYIRMPVTALSRLPAAMGRPWAVLVEPAVTVVEALTRAGCGPFDRVAVLGTGTIGLLAVQLVLPTAGEVTAVGLDAAGLREAASLGASAVPTTAARGPYSLVIEASGAPEAFAQALDLVAPGGRVALVGVAYEPVAVRPADLVLRGVSLLGVQHGIDHYDVVVRLFGQGRLDGEGLLAATLPSAGAHEAFALLGRGRRGRPKVVLDLGDLPGAVAGPGAAR